jgi:hypothetical protein
VHRALIALWLVACGSGPQRVGSQPSWRHAGSGEVSAPVTLSAAEPAVFTPAGEPASRYNEPLQPPPHSDLGDAVIVAMRDAAAQAHLPAPIADARLFRAAGELARILPEEGGLDEQAIAFAIQREGVIEASHNLRGAWDNLDNPDAIAKAFAADLPNLIADLGGPARFGFGAVPRSSDGRGAIVLIVVGAELATSPIPRQLPPHGSFRLDGTLDARYHDPEVFVTYDDHSVERLAPAVGQNGAFQLDFACGNRKGVEQVEIGATGGRGWNTIANFPVWCAAHAPTTLRLPPVSPPFEGTVEAAEGELFARVNEERHAAGLEPLAWDERVARVARKYSAEMAKTKIVAHVSPTSGSHGDRLRAASIITHDSEETVARGYSISDVHAGLMNSPAHRAALLHREATHIGIGLTVSDEGGRRPALYVTDLLIRIPPKIDPTKVAAIVKDRINAVHPVVANAELSQIAQALVDGLVAGKKTDETWPSVKKRADALGNQFARFTSLTTIVASTDEIDGKLFLGDHPLDAIGVGVAQANHPEMGENAIWIVVLGAERTKN